MWVEMIVFGLLLAVLVLTLYMVNLPEGDAEAKAAAFTAIVFYELVRVLQIRYQFHNNFWSNPWLWGAVIISLLLHFLLLSVPVFAQLFGITPLDVADWLMILSGTVVVTLIFSGARHLINYGWQLKPKKATYKIAPS
jgi:Ca2+-transporting ATPase